MRRVCRGAEGPTGGDDDKPFLSGWLLGVDGLWVPFFPSHLPCVSDGSIAASREVCLPVHHLQHSRVPNGLKGIVLVHSIFKGHRKRIKNNKSSPFNPCSSLRL